MNEFETQNYHECGSQKSLNVDPLASVLTFISDRGPRDIFTPEAKRYALHSSLVRLEPQHRQHGSPQTPAVSTSTLLT